MLKNLRIGIKMAIGFGTLTLFLIVVAVLSLNSMNSISHDLDMIANDRYPNVQIANRMMHHANQISRLTRVVPLSNDTAQRLEWRQRVEDSQRAGEAELETLRERMIGVAEGGAYFQEIERTRDEIGRAYV